MAQTFIHQTTLRTAPQYQISSK